MESVLNESVQICKLYRIKHRHIVINVVDVIFIHNLAVKNKKLNDVKLSRRLTLVKSRVIDSVSRLKITDVSTLMMGTEIAPETSVIFN
jgi:hypothetical protein